MTVHIVVPGVAATGETRVRKATGFMYTPPAVVKWKKHVAACARQACLRPLEGPVTVSITIRRVRPPSWPDRPTKAQPWAWAPFRKPDLDNGAYHISNALSGIVYEDDARIVDSHHRKEWADRDEVVITVAEAQEHYHGAATGSGAPRLIEESETP